MVIDIKTDDDFKQLLSKNEKVVVKYYAEWCGSCRLFAPKFKRLALDDRFEGVTFIDVNAEENPEARKLGNVTNLPTFATFENGKLVTSIASNKEEAVVELINKLN